MLLSLARGTANLADIVMHLPRPHHYPGTVNMLARLIHVAMKTGRSDCFKTLYCYCGEHGHSAVLQQYREGALRELSFLTVREPYLREIVTTEL